MKKHLAAGLVIAGVVLSAGAAMSASTSKNTRPQPPSFGQGGKPPMMMSGDRPPMPPDGKQPPMSGDKRPPRPPRSGDKRPPEFNGQRPNMNNN